VIYWKNFSDSQRTFIKVFRQFKRGYFKEYAEHSLNNLEIQASSQPFFLDINGDMITDLMFVTADPVQPQIVVALGLDTRGEKFKIFPFSDFLVSSQEDSRCQDPSPVDMISSPHSNSFVDLDGDCMPDIFLQKTKVTTDPNTLAKYYQTYFEVYT
jgi:hypothetical protein